MTTTYIVLTAGIIIVIISAWRLGRMLDEKGKKDAMKYEKYFLILMCVGFAMAILSPLFPFIFPFISLKIF